jgi:DNA-binding YbaB/EbfC family protein
MNIQKLMKEAQKAQLKMQEAQQRLASLEVEGSAGGGMVTAKANGEGTVTRVKIDPGVVDPEDVDMLEDLVTAAIADAQRKAKELQEQEMGEAMGGMGGLGGLGGMF